MPITSSYKFCKMLIYFISIPKGIFQIISRKRHITSIKDIRKYREFRITHISHRKTAGPTTICYCVSFYKFLVLELLSIARNNKK
ncbi:MAG TPA: hypothetical protein DEW31_03785 [Alistipes obesi]|nr:hypothetical protein [Alistipes communis]